VSRCSDMTRIRVGLWSTKVLRKSRFIDASCFTISHFLHHLRQQYIPPLPVSVSHSLQTVSSAWKTFANNWRLSTGSMRFCHRTNSVKALNGTHVPCRDFFKKLRDPSSCIHHLLPPARDSDLTSRLIRASIYPRPRNRTNRYKSFIHHALLNYQ